MSLKLLQAGREPLGQFDCLDADLPNVKGGEVMLFANVVAPNPPGTDKAAADSFDGYVNPAGTQNRTVARLFNADGYGPAMLSDDGIKGYGTIFGTVVGATVGQVSYGPRSAVAASDLLGPHTAKASGKVTLWDKPGLYAVSLDAVDTSAGQGLQPTNLVLGAGAKVYVMNDGTGRLTSVASPSHYTIGCVGRFVEFETNGSLVTTPNKLVAALNSPSGNVTSVGLGQYDFAVIWFAGGQPIT